MIRLISDQGVNEPMVVRNGLTDGPELLELVGKVVLEFVPGPLAFCAWPTETKRRSTAA